MKYGYARASTDGQSVTAQVAELTKAGCVKVFQETASGAQTARAQLRKVLDQLEAGGVLMVTRLDRLARSTCDLLNTLGTITDRKAGFRSRGVKMGRPPKLPPHQKKEALRRLAAGETVRDIALTYNVHNSTISRLEAVRGA